MNLSCDMARRQPLEPGPDRRGVQTQLPADPAKATDADRVRGEPGLRVASNQDAVRGIAHHVQSQHVKNRAQNDRVPESPLRDLHSEAWFYDKVLGKSVGSHRAAIIAERKR